MAAYTVGTVRLSGGYEHIAFNNPDTPLARGSLTIGGYVLAFTNNTAFNNQKILQVFWAGAKIGLSPSLDLLAAYYGYKQNSFATGAHAGCSDNSSGGCSGTENSFSWCSIIASASASTAISAPSIPGQGWTGQRLRLQYFHGEHHHGYPLQILEPVQGSKFPTTPAAAAAR